MNRRKFIQSALGFIALAPIAKIMGNSALKDDTPFVKQGETILPRHATQKLSESRIGFISIECLPAGTFPGDWTVYVNGSPVPHKGPNGKYVQSANDIEGWFEYFSADENGHVIIDEFSQFVRKREYANVSIVYNPHRFS